MEHFEVEVDQKNIIRLRLGDLTLGKLDELKEWTEKVSKTVLDLYNRTGEKVRTIIDITDLKKYDSKAFIILTSLLKTTEQYTLKTATFGGDEYILTAQDALLALSGRKNLKAFKTEEEAFDWLILE